MDIRRPLADRVQQHLLDESDDRRVVDLGLGAFCGRVGAFLLAMQQVHVELVAGQFLERIRCGFRKLCHRGNELVCFDNYRVNREAGLEPDFVEGTQIGRIGQCHRQPVPSPRQSHHHVRLHQLVVYRVARKLRLVECRQIGHWVAERL